MSTVVVLWIGPELAVHREGAGEMRTSVDTEMVKRWNVTALLKSDYIIHKAREEEICSRTQEKLDYFN